MHCFFFQFCFVNVSFSWISQFSIVDVESRKCENHELLLIKPVNSVSTDIATMATLLAAIYDSVLTAYQVEFFIFLKHKRLIWLFFYDVLGLSYYNPNSQN